LKATAVAHDCVPSAGAYLGPITPIPEMATILTPCENICTLDPASGLCRGCGRNLAEIERWTAYSDAERARVMGELPNRLAAMGMAGLAEKP
jgi:predicted Fe-S protein YdhL (DUF1289 family)